MKVGEIFVDKHIYISTTSPILIEFKCKTKTFFNDAFNI